MQWCIPIKSNSSTTSGWKKNRLKVKNNIKKSKDMSPTGTSMCYESMVTCVYKVMTFKKEKTTINEHVDNSDFIKRWLSLKVNS